MLKIQSIMKDGYRSYRQQTQKLIQVNYLVLADSPLLALRATLGIGGGAYFILEGVSLNFNINKSSLDLKEASLYRRTLLIAKTKIDLLLYSNEITNSQLF